MPSWCAASMTELPGATWVAFPSISRFSRGRASDIRRHQAALVVDVVLELVAEVLDEALHRQRRRVAERAYRAAGDVVGGRDEHLEILASSLAVLDAVDHAPQPAGAFPAGRALTARLGEVEVGKPQQRT